MESIAVVTKYFGPKNVKGSRIKCLSYSKKSCFYNYDSSARCAHEEAARLYGSYIFGGGHLKIEKFNSPENTGYIFIISPLPF